MKTKCGWTGGKLLLCPTMMDHADRAPSHKKGLSYVVVADIATLEYATYGIVYKKTANDRGLMLNYCPWCGADISPRGQEQC